MRTRGYETEPVAAPGWLDEDGAYIQTQVYALPTGDYKFNGTRAVPAGASQDDGSSLLSGLFHGRLVLFLVTLPVP